MFIRDTCAAGLLVLALAIGPQVSIHDAAAKGDLETLRSLLDSQPALLDAGKPPLGNTPLHFAAQKGQLAAATLLLDRGADVNRSNGAGLTPLHLAAGLPDTSILELLLARGAKPNAVALDGATPLWFATAWEQPASMKALLDKGADPRVKGPAGQTVLHLAALVGDAGTIALLAAKGADINATATNGDTPLMVACRTGNPATASALLERGADPARRDASGRTPLDAAVSTGKTALVKRILDAGVKPEATTAADRRSSLHVAAAHGWLEMTTMLLAAGADRAATDAQGRTPLDLASRYGNARVASALKGAPVVLKSPRVLPLTPPPPGEATVWFLGHMGWAIRTSHHLLVFDYDGRTVPPDEPSLANGSIDPREIADVPTTVFISHGHSDHYAPAVFDWRKTVRQIAYVTGFKPEGKDGYVFMGPRETKAIDGVEITTIEATDEGVGFLVRADGLAFFHSGDHVQVPGSLGFRPEIDFLAERGVPVDALFMPISMAHFPGMNDGVLYAARRLSARTLFPGHLRGREQGCGEFAAQAAAAGLATPTRCPEYGGDRFALKAAKAGPGK